MPVETCEAPVSVRPASGVVRAAAWPEPDTALAAPRAAPPRRQATSQIGARERHRRALVLLALQAYVLRARDSSQAAEAVARELARNLECNRVSIGLAPPPAELKRLRVIASSGAEQKRLEDHLSNALAAAMIEAASQRLCITWPRPARSRPLNTQAHRALARCNGKLAICTAPLYELSPPAIRHQQPGRQCANAPPVAGAIIFERAGGFEPEHVMAMLDAATFVGPLLILRHRVDLPLHTRLFEAFIRHAQSWRARLAG